jgi:hypothetical protein
MLKGDLPGWASSRHEFVYKCRQALESKFASLLMPALVSWIWGNSAVPVPHKRIFSDVTPRRKVIPVMVDEAVHTKFVHRDLLWAYAHEKWLGFATFSGTICRYEIDGARLTAVGVSQRQDVASLEWFHNGNDVRTYAKAAKMLRNSDRCCEKIIARKLVVFEGSEMVYSPDEIVVMNDRDEVVCSSEGRIVVLQANWVFHLVVFATVRGFVHFRNLPNGRKVADVDVGDIVTAVEITPKWGSVLLLSMHTLRVHDVNGIAVKSVQLDKEILCWCAFACPFGFDYVVFADSGGDVRLFEAFFPERIKTVESIPQVLALGFDSSISRLTVITVTGELHLIPWALREPDDPPGTT